MARGGGGGEYSHKRQSRNLHTASCNSPISHKIIWWTKKREEGSANARYRNLVERSASFWASERLGLRNHATAAPHNEDYDTYTFTA